MVSYFNKFIFFSLTIFIFSFISKEALSDGHSNFEWTPDKPYYVIEDPNAEGSEKQAINKASYYGYRIFHQNCHVCHGKAARGSSFAPNLLDSYNYAKKGEKMGNKVKYDTPYEWFLDTVVNGYKREMAGGTVNVMPGHGDVTDVMTNIDGIYGYIAAMADGKLTTTNRPGKGWKIK